MKFAGTYVAKHPVATGNKFSDIGTEPTTPTYPEPSIQTVITVCFGQKGEEF